MALTKKGHKKPKHMAKHKKPQVMDVNVINPDKVNNFANVEKLNRDAKILGISKKVAIKKTYLAYKDFTLSDVGTTFFYAPVASQIPDFANYANLYTQYRVVKIRYIFNQINIDVSDGAAFPDLFVWKNNDSSLSTLSLARVEETKNVDRVKFSNTGVYYEKTVIPYVADPIYVSAVATGYKQMYTPWIDVLYNNVPLYSLGVLVNALPTGTIVEMDIEFTVEFKNPK